MTELEAKVEHRWFVRCAIRNDRWNYIPACTCGWEGKAEVPHLKGEELEPRSGPEARAAELAYLHSRVSRG
jgi:hypothetical protein